jgi:hypothetical protein
MQVRHLVCANPGCFEPSHLSHGSVYDNIDDRERDGHTARGEQHGRAKLTRDAVRAIWARLTAGDTKSRIAKEYGVSRRAIRLIETGANWGWLAK